MTRVVSVGRSKGLVAAGALGLALVALTLTGCPGSLDDPSQFPPPTTGAAGSTGAAGAVAMMDGGTTGAGGGTPGCDITPLIAKYTCTIMGSCHDAAGSSANFSMVGNWTTKLVGVTPKGGGAVLQSACGASTLPYIIAKSSTGDGLFIKKLQASPPCGLQMPFGLTAVNATDLACFKQFTTALANQ